MHPRYIQNVLYEFHHEYKLLLFHEKCKIMYTDMESYLSHRVRRWNAISRFIIDSIWAIDNAYNISLVSKKVSCLMKDENNAIMTEFVRLRAKIYISRVDGKKDAKKTKDIKSNV